jgi:poly(hydroxyalkanoate) depolymerase family esterase
MPTYAFAGRMAGLSPAALLILVVGCSQPLPTPLEEVSAFGSNPGELRMLKYVPGSPDPGSPGTRMESIDGQAGAQGAGATPSNDSRGRHDRFPRPGPHPEGEGDLRRTARDLHRKVSQTDKSPTPGAPLVVALHGCMQNAAQYGEDSGWLRLADRWGFLLLLPEQRRGNNLTRCFNWYSPDDTRRDKGEALSIFQMIDRMQRDYPIDPQRIYVTGISAGAAMTVALAALYPEVFAGAAPVAGIAFGCADGLLSALSCMRDPPEREAAEWGAVVRSAAAHKGAWPRISVWQGEADSAVNPANASAILRQWTDVHGIDDIPEQVDETEGYAHSVYRNSQGRALVESYRIKDMGHGVPVDPGPGENQCGKAARFFPDVDICSSLYIARFWGLTH